MYLNLSYKGRCWIIKRYWEFQLCFSFPKIRSQLPPGHHRKRWHQRKGLAQPGQDRSDFSTWVPWGKHAKCMGNVWEFYGKLLGFTMERMQWSTWRNLHGRSEQNSTSLELSWSAGNAIDQSTVQPSIGRCNSSCVIILNHLIELLMPMDPNKNHLTVIDSVWI